MQRIFSDREIHEECGVFGAIGIDDAAMLTYYGLHSLQHRGQESCGIVTSTAEGEFARKRGDGLVSEVFTDASMANLKGDCAIGHVRYSTSGDGSLENVQPFLFRHHTGNFAMAHNGNLVNSEELRRYLESLGSLFQSTSDSEVLAHLIKKQTLQQHRISAIVEALNMIEGAFAFLIMTPNRIYACRDKYGLRPLSIGKLAGGLVVSSETCGLDVVGAEYVRDVEPGEIVSLERDGTMRSTRFAQATHRYMCAMEYIYFARPDSNIEGCNVHTFRKETGRMLWAQSPVEADIVVGVPDSSLSAAIGYAEASGIPYEMGLIKSKYVGRTFIQPSQALREKGVRMKLSAVKSIVRGKRVVLIDDSIVRGTTSKRIIRMLKESGAVEVHVRIASPEYRNPCFYGVDTSAQNELLSFRMSSEQACDYIEADSLEFLAVDALYQAGEREELCTACFTGCYPTDLYGSDKGCKILKIK